MCHDSKYCNLPAVVHSLSDEHRCILHGIEHAYAMHYGLLRNRLETIATAKAQGRYDPEIFEGPDGYLVKDIAKYLELADRLRASYEAGEFSFALEPMIGTR